MLQIFAQNLYAMKMNDAYINSENKIRYISPNAQSQLSLYPYNTKIIFSLATSKSFIKANSQTEVSGLKKLDRLDSLRGSTTDSQTEDTFGPLSNVR